MTFFCCSFSATPAAFSSQKTIFAMAGPYSPSIDATSSTTLPSFLTTRVFSP